MVHFFGYRIEKAENKNNGKKVSIWLDTYDDIFSDFDPSPYGQRHISDDFFHELKKYALEDMPGNVEIDLLIDEKLRDIKTEKIIIERINEFFAIQHRVLQKKRNRILMQSFLFLLLGTVFITILTLASRKYEQYLLLIKLLEPASWFLSWEGLHLLFFEYVEEKDHEEFHKKVSHSRITFQNKI